ncbi:hypothetical protein C1637_06205 [Chryseobacterium lactis]|uniref:DUF4296 domain-containing protein n=1 Tax=Chryseobacterium lactis TaxID=1241981 RepID=A0A3G6RTK3_CHRLC|nr:hypothetical protein [Chryseobacterium lactis]AZA84432.1 hypothetical protein EG342_22175 [Chryseobacterium lactis]AZB04820.1 hypothetical protein EG341_13055 [Chryseobacterium lactis]PNW14551.1 hypothetical protein C1637_06205 [Chryseobacterium lactis]
MRYFIIALLVSVGLYSQGTLNAVQQKLLNDNAAYQQFMDLGKCQCMDILIQKTKIYRVQSIGKNNSLFNRHYYTLYDLGYALPTFYKIEAVKSTIIDFQNKNMANVITFYQDKDEHIKEDYSSPFLLCNKLFESENMTIEMYKKLINDSKAYMHNIQNENKYLNNH